MDRKPAKGMKRTGRILREYEGPPYKITCIGNPPVLTRGFITWVECYEKPRKRRK